MTFKRCVMKKSTITLDNPSKFANDLWSEIVDSALFSRPKNDICDYLLYLFNKHDSAHFLDSNSNEENERLLKMNASKIKSSKKNIAIKFMDSGEYSDIFKDFLDELVERARNNQLDIKKGKINITIENTALRDILSAKLKDSVKTAPDYNTNSENVSISITNFLTMIRNEVANENQPQYDEMLEKLKSKYTKEKVKDIFGAILGNAGNLNSLFNLIKW